MQLSWNEIRARTATFAKAWQNAAYEKGETHSFYKRLLQNLRCQAAQRGAL